MDIQYKTLVGDPNTVKTKGEEYKAIAAAISSAVATLDDIVEQVENKSLAMDATRAMAEGVASDIRKATDRYQATGDALVVYADALDQAKKDSQQPAAQIALLEYDLVAARAAAWRAVQDLMIAQGSGDSDAITLAQRELRDADATVATLETSLAAEQTRWESALEAKTLAAAVAIGRIVEATEGDGGKALNDDFWDHVGVAVEILKIICDIAGILAIFLSWVPVLGQILVVLAAIGALMAVLDAGIKLMRGEGGWGDFFGALALAALSLYGGKLLGFAAKRLHLSALKQVPLGTRLPKASVSLKSDQLISSKGATVANFLKSPFVRSAQDIKYSDIAKVSGLRGVIAEAIRENPFKLTKLLKYDGDVLNLRDLFKLAESVDLDPALLQVAMSLQVLELGHSVHKNAESVVNLVNSHKDNTATDFALDVVEEGLGRADGVIPGVLKDSIGVGQAIEDVLQTGTN